MYGHHRSSPHLYNTSPYSIPVYAPASFQAISFDSNWSKTWPNMKSIIVAIGLILSSATIISLDIANLAIEGNKTNGTSRLGVGTGKVGAGIWTGTITFFTAISILVIAFIRNKRVLATFALFSVILAFCLNVVLIGLVGNAIQNNLYTTISTDADNLQNKLLIAILAIAIFTIIFCLIFLAIYVRVFFSSSTRLSNRY